MGMGWTQTSKQHCQTEKLIRLNKHGNGQQGTSGWSIVERGLGKVPKTECAGDMDLHKGSTGIMMMDFTIFRN